MTTEERYQLIYGNTARVADVAPEPVKPEKPKKRRQNNRQTKAEPAFGVEWKSKRVYVAILLVAVCCLSYIYLDTGNKALRKEVASLKTELNASQVENDDLKAEISSGIDYDNIKKIATTQYGMTKPGKSHIIKYTNANDDYVRQYESIPN